MQRERCIALKFTRTNHLLSMNCNALLLKRQNIRILGSMNAAKYADT